MANIRKTRAHRNWQGELGKIGQKAKAREGATPGVVNVYKETASVPSSFSIGDCGGAIVVTNTLKCLESRW